MSDSRWFLPKSRVRDREVPSAIRWSGSKRGLAPRLLALVPAKFNRYWEPFLGGGALMHSLGKTGSIGSDIYEPLIAFWLKVRDTPEALADNYARQWRGLQDEGQAYYYETRKRFNRSQTPEDLSFLTRTCVNGIVRFNSKGEFNSSYHLTRKGMRPPTLRRNLRAWHGRIQGVEFKTMDYLEAVTEAKRGDFMYLDPPYAGVTGWYIDNVDFDQLHERLDELNHRGVRWMLSCDGQRDDRDYANPVPSGLFERELLLPAYTSKLLSVLVGNKEAVSERLYLNY